MSNNTLTGGNLGGTNATGSQPTVTSAATVQTAPKRRKGWFQYGDNQWGYINERGNVNWKAKQPDLNRNRVLNWKNVRNYLKSTGGLTGMPKQAGKSPQWISSDPLYQRN